MDIDENLSLIKVCLDANLRIGVSYTSLDKTVQVEYQFVKNGPNVIESRLDLETEVECIFYRSNNTDPLKLFGSKRTADDFLRYLQNDKKYVPGETYIRSGVKVYPRDWYDCFEELAEKRLEPIRDMMPELLKLATTTPVELINPGMTVIDRRSEDISVIKSVFFSITNDGVIKK